MEEIIKALRNGLSVESLEVSLPYLEPFNLLVDYESELDYSSSGSHRDRQRRLVSRDPRKKLLTQLPKNPTEFEKELRNLVLKLYSAGESERNDTAEQITDETDLPVVRTTSPLLTSNSNSSVTWRSGEKEGTAIPSLAFVSPQLDGICKTGSTLEPARGLKDSLLDAAGLTTEEKTANQELALQEEESVATAQLVPDHSILLGNTDEPAVDLHDSIQIDKKEKFELTTECQLNLEESDNDTETFVQTIESNCVEGAETTENSGAKSSTLYPRSAQTGKPRDHVFDVPPLEPRGDRGSGLNEDHKGCETFLDSRSTRPLPLLETAVERVVSTALDNHETDVRTTGVAKLKAETTVHLASLASATSTGKLPLHTSLISDFDLIHNKDTDTGQNNVPSCLIIDNCTSSVKLKDDIINTPLPSVNLESSVRDSVQQVGTFGKNPSNTMEDDTSYQHSRSLLIQDVCRGPSLQNVTRSFEKITETQHGSEKTQGNPEPQKEKIWETRVSVSKGTTWPGGARKTDFQEGDLQLSRCDSGR